jgi:hypothetical protein
MAKKQSFEQWKEKVDKIIADKLGGFTSDDLPDICYADLYEDGISPSAAAKQAMSMEY